MTKAESETILYRQLGVVISLLFLHSKPIRHFLASTASETNYRNLDINQAQVVMNMLQEILPSTTFLKNELVFETPSSTALLISSLKRKSCLTTICGTYPSI